MRLPCLVSVCSRLCRAFVRRAMEFLSRMGGRKADCPLSSSRKFDWVEQVWPADMKKPGEYPRVQKYCLMSVERSWTVRLFLSPSPFSFQLTLLPRRTGTSTSPVPPSSTTSSAAARRSTSSVQRRRTCRLTSGGAGRARCRRVAGWGIRLIRCMS